jgi:FtsZ-binding cell division protein ZapB
MATQSNDFQTRLDNIKTTFGMATDEYIARYPLATMNPKVKTYQTPFQNALKSINSVNADLFLLESEVSSAIDNISQDIKQSNTKITELKNSNDALEKDVDNARGADKGSKKRYTDSQQKSFLELYSSIGLGIIAYFTFIKIRGVLKQ